MQGTARLGPAGCRTGLEEPDEIADRTVSVPRMTERQVAMDFVLVASPVTGLGEVPRPLEVVDDVRDGSFGDADAGGDVSEASAGVDGDAFEHVRVVRHESPEVLVSST